MTSAELLALKTCRWTRVEYARLIECGVLQADEPVESSYRIDHAFKVGLYARAGVADYWIVDVTRNAVDGHRRPEAASDAADPLP